MIAVKTPRRLRLNEDEQDSLLAGVDFQVHYLGNKELLMADNDIDDVVEDAYSRYITNAELLSATTRLAITVDTHQLMFFNVIRNETEFDIAVSNIKAVHSGTKRTKFPNAIILVTYVARGDSTRAYVFHCTSQRKAKELYKAINRSYENNVTKNNLKDDHEEMSGNLRRVQFSSTENKGKEKSTETKSRKCEGETSVRSDADTSPVQVDMNTSESSQEREKPRGKSRSKSATQSKGAEGLGLLANIDPEDGFDDEFMNLARSRSISDTFKIFGR